ncbi:MAG: aminoglycoside 6-adenylyltransferase [Saprospiraceae bacterium]
MRSEEQIITTIISVAKKDERIRAVILNGSRTNKNVVKDDFQDFDIIYLVKELSSFENSPNWIDVFGERIILQLPNSMIIDDIPVESGEEITYLMLFKDFNRIDLNLIKVENQKDCNDSLNKILLDKDNLFDQIVEPTDEDYLVKQPSQKEFHDCCNEFWWVSTYVVKGLARNELLYAKEMLEEPVRKMFMKMIAWYAVGEKGFSINIGKSNRFLKKHVNLSLWNSILKTYPNAEKVNIWNSLKEMAALFYEISPEVARKTGLTYDRVEAENVRKYLQQMEERIMR